MHCIHPFFSGLPSDQRNRCSFLLPCCQKCSQHKTNKIVFLDPLWGPKRGSRKWTPKWGSRNWAQEIYSTKGPVVLIKKKSKHFQLRGSILGSTFRTPFWGPVSGPHFGSTFWVPFSVPKMNTKNHKCLLYKSTCVANIFEGKEAENHVLVPF